MTAAGTLYGIGTGPGDPELLTLKAARMIAAAPVVAYFAKSGNPGKARTTAKPHIAAAAVEVPLYYPATVEVPADTPAYAELMNSFYDEAAASLAAHLKSGRDVVVLCEGDPFFYGSYMYLHDRLADQFTNTVVPGVTGMAGCAAFAVLHMTY